MWRKSTLHMTRQSFKHGGGPIVLSVCFSVIIIGQLVLIQRITGSRNHVQTLEANLNKSTEKLNLLRLFVSRSIVLILC